MKFQLALLVAGLAMAMAAPEIDSKIYKNFEEKATQTVTVSFKNSQTNEIRERFTTRVAATLSTRSAKVNTLYNMLKDHADVTQENVLAYLNKQVALDSSVRIEQLWMSNEINIRNANKRIVEDLKAFPEISKVYADRIIPLHQPVKREIVHPSAINANPWGIDAVHAEAAWAQGFSGQGVVVATIDTGVRGTHEALRNNHREENGWYDPAYGTTVPTDSDGHGTHTMGTIAGNFNNIGVAPNATWIACVGCGMFGCSLADLRGCGNWAGCPNNDKPTCDGAPNLVSNSWGGGQGDAFYDEIIDTWVAADIAPLFSQGNAGPSCGSANSPGDSIKAIGIGSTTEANGLSSFSSVGPTYRGHRIKPDFAAPGSDVLSSYNSGDSAYASLSGTSMACPHAAGISALLYSKNPNLTIDELKAALTKGAQGINSSGRNCGGIDENDRPNHHVGAGRLDALASL